jgi:hypothetical protein
VVGGGGGVSEAEAKLAVEETRVELKSSALDWHRFATILKEGEMTSERKMQYKK